MPCRFCGEDFGPDRAKSDEHAMPKWLAAFMPNPEGSNFRHTIQEAGTGDVLAEWNNDELAIIASRVCQPCNNGWMNDLENRVRPYLTTLLRGNGRTFQREGQAVLAPWAVKTALAFNLATPDAPTIPERAYRQLAESKGAVPPDGFQVWLGAYSGWRHGHYNATQLALETADGASHYAYQATLTVRYAVFSIFGHPLDDEVTLTKRGARAEMATQIWPILGPVVWPPKIVVTEHTMGYFVQSFRTAGYTTP